MQVLCLVGLLSVLTLLLVEVMGNGSEEAG